MLILFLIIDNIKNIGVKDENSTNSNYAYDMNINYDTLRNTHTMDVLWLLLSSVKEEKKNKQVSSQEYTYNFL